MEDSTLFKLTNSYDIKILKDVCRAEIKKQFPKAVEEEDYSDYLEFIEDETNLLYAQRLREIADEIENRVLKPQKLKIKCLYSKT